MARYVRDKDGNLYIVQRSTATHYSAIRIKDKVPVLLRINECIPVEKIDQYPGDWAIGF